MSERKSVGAVDYCAHLLCSCRTCWTVVERQRFLRLLCTIQLNSP